MNIIVVKNTFFLYETQILKPQSLNPEFHYTTYHTPGSSCGTCGAKLTSQPNKGWLSKPQEHLKENDCWKSKKEVAHVGGKEIKRVVHKQPTQRATHRRQAKGCVQAVKKQKLLCKWQVRQQQWQMLGQVNVQAWQRVPSTSSWVEEIDSSSRM